MKKHLFPSIILIALFSTLYSCKKETIANNTKNTIIKDDTKRIPIDYSRIKVKNIASRSINVLEFESWEHFNEVKNELNQLCNDHAYAFFEPLSQQNSDYDYLTTAAEESEFNQFQPIHNFCEDLNFQSLYQVTESDEQDWLANNTSSVLDFTSDPFSSFERIESALFNKDGMVIIDNQEFTIELTNSYGKNTSSSCSHWADAFGECSSYSYSGKSRKVKGNTGPRPLENISSSTSYYRKGNGSWGLWFTKIYTEIYGTPYMNNGGSCNENLNTNDSKNRQLPWGCYVYRERYTGQNSWGIKYENKIQSIHKAPGLGFSGGYQYQKGF